MPQATDLQQVTERQRLFVEEYCKDHNATQAAIRAGYSKKTAHAAGSRLLKNVKVQAGIDATLTSHLAEVSEGTKAAIIDEQRLLAEASAIATSNLWDLIERVTSRGIVWKDLNSLPPEIQRTVQKIKVDPGKGSVEVTLHSKHPAHERLFKHYDLFDRPKAVEDKDRPETDPELARRASRWLREVSEMPGRNGDEMTVGEVRQLLEDGADRIEAEEKGEI